MHICLIQGPQLDIPDILNKYFARSTWTIFAFPSFNAIFEKSQRSCLTDINRYLLPELASTTWNTVNSLINGRIHFPRRIAGQTLTDDALKSGQAISGLSF